MKKYYLLVSAIIVIIGGFLIYQVNSITIEKLTLLSSQHPSMETKISVVLNKKTPMSIEYWVEGSKKHYKKHLFQEKVKHQFRLLFLQPDTTYKYKIVLNRFFGKRSSVVKSFRTARQPPWLSFGWLNRKEAHHTAKALAGGMVMAYTRKIPGSIMMIDANGAVRWNWQADSNSVKVANITPRGTIIALLGKPHTPKISKVDKHIVQESEYPLRFGKIGYLGGYIIVEIDSNGNVLRRIDLRNLKKPLIAHHDLRMDEKGNIYFIYRDPIKYSMEGLNKDTVDTLWGDGVAEINKEGKVINKWSSWDGWDIKDDPKLPKFAYDRFHLNSLYIDTDGNYIVSSPIENQVWKINKKSGEIMWKLGKNGDFKMPPKDYFAFQHNAHINRNGNLMVFNNGDTTPLNSTKPHEKTQIISFKVDTVNWKAKKVADVYLPKDKYTSRMGSADLLPNGNFLWASSKTATVGVEDRSGNIQWELNLPFIPYKTAYISPELLKEWRN
jgi:hypothetical protein